MVLSSVTVIIPTRGRPEALKRCLKKLLLHVNQHPECMIIVSDDGEASETSAALGNDFAGVHVVQGPRRGPAANRNCGAKHSSGHLIIFLDDDCIPDPNIIAAYQEAALENPEIGVFEGRITAEGTETGFADTAPSNETGGYLWSCNFAIRRDLFTSIGGFDERYPFPGMEDVDFHFRVTNKSRIRFLPEARVFHAVERRVGWKGLKHYALSLILYLHLHGLRQTKKGPVYFARVIARLSVTGGVRYLRGQAAKDPEHLLSTVWVHMEILFIVLFWRCHPYLAKTIFPACCPGCESIHTSLSGH
jgi:GT2 family glycosyltransferase